MYYFNGIEYEKYEDAEIARFHYSGTSNTIYVACHIHGLAEAFYGHCEHCVLEVYEEYLDKLGGLQA